MKNITRLLMLLLAASVVFITEPQAAGEVTTKLKNRYSAENTPDITFDLTIFWSVRERFEKKKGRLMYAPGEKFRLELGNATWASDGLTYWQHSSSTNQVIIKDLLDLDLSLHPSFMMESFLAYPFTLKDISGSEGLLSWSGEVPKDDMPYKSVTVLFDKNKMEIKELTLLDTEDNESRYVFRRTRLNADHKNSDFTFTIPEGTDVLDSRK